MTTKPQATTEDTWRSDKAREAICDAAERIANQYCSEDDTYDLEVRRLRVAIINAVDQRATPASAAPVVDANEAANKIADYFNAPLSVIPAIEKIIQRCPAAPFAATREEELRDAMERDAMIDTIKELENDRDNLRQVARMALQQFEFTYGKRKRGWDAKFLMERLQAVINDSEGHASAGEPFTVRTQARAAVEQLNKEGCWLLSDATPEELDQIAEIIASHFAATTAAPVEQSDMISDCEPENEQ